MKLCLIVNNPLKVTLQNPEFHGCHFPIFKKYIVYKKFSKKYIEVTQILAEKIGKILL